MASTMLLSLLHTYLMELGWGREGKYKALSLPSLKVFSSPSVVEKRILFREIKPFSPNIEAFDMYYFYCLFLTYKRLNLF